jgi:hypothetical protein
MFLKAFLTGYTDMVKTSNDLDRLRYAPQRVEAGVFYNFHDTDMFKGAVEGLESLNIELIKAERVNDTTRFTSALQRDYFAGFNKMMDLVAKTDTGGYTTTADTDEPVEVTLEDKILEVVKAGDKKAFRSLRKELKDKWFALDDADVEDAIFDLGDAVADKDVEYAKEILENVGEDDAPAEEPEPEVKEIKETPKKTAKLTEEESEIIEDLKSAIDDGDQKDIDELLAELKEVNEALYDEWLPATQVEQPEEDTKDEEDSSVVDEIIEDLDAAIADEDEDEAKACLEELADEVGVDSDIYKVNAEKLTPKKTRRSRRGK